MVSQNHLSELRSRIAKLEKNATRKISRVRRTVGAEIAGTQFDPRKEKGKAATMRGRDLEAYARRLSAFTSRTTQFEAGVRGAPLPRAKWKQAEAANRAARAVAEQKLKPIADKRLPGPGTETIGQRQAKIRSNHPTAMNMGFIPPEIKPFNIKDVAALDKLTKANKKRTTKKWAAEEHKRAQNEFMKMVEVFKDDSLNKDVMKLSMGQFDVLWNFTRFADAMSLTYHSIKQKYTAKQEVPESVLKDQVNEAKSLIDWVKKMKI